ncbi:hypothetical protein [Paucibacter sp. DJ2R-2]|uniref:hypothetical protein n=1 Tax=Paucibacter sp. DJ2R-2 TaxID=2893558 RepID=UPI0021E491F1|nr:hypothetical protein [Paucibacter sp. DJ2R-2]MCV2420344.1 hypothetical protein [Paucibacter sp. DJ4R-1]MCV2436711.1 hypothetical protein [Paucibacter sp. DJ2R-2]
MTTNLLLHLVMWFTTIVGLGIGARLYLLNKSLKAEQDRMVRELAIQPGISWYRINISRPEHFKKRLKLSPFEGKGILIRSPQGLRLSASFPEEGKFQAQCELARMRVRWLGNVGMASGNLHWIGLDLDGQKLAVCADTGLNAVSSREATADLMLSLAPQHQLPESARQDFALEKNLASLMVACASLALIMVALFDGAMFNPYELQLASTPLLYWIPFVAVLASGLYPILKAAKVPARESVTLTVLAGAALCLCFIPICKRLDQGLSGTGAQMYPFVVKSVGLLEAQVPGPPTMRFVKMPEYWAQVPVGSHYSLRFVNGPLGMWQLDPRELYSAYEAFENEQAAAKKAP